MKCSLPFVVLLLLVVSFAIANSQPSLSNESQKAMVLSKLSAMPLSFTENRGQWDEKALFKAEAGGATFFFCKDEVVYLFTRDTDELIADGQPHGHDMPQRMPDKFNHPRYKKESMVLKAKFVGVNPNSEIVGLDRLSYNCNYFIGDDPSKWTTDVPNYSSVTYKDIYPGIDLKYHGDGKGMKYDFIISPGADISQIKIKYDGVDGLDVTSNGDLQAVTRFGPVYERIPQIYQEIDGQKREISGHYILHEPGVFGFAIEENFNPAYPVIIDPSLVYSTYFGGHGTEWSWDIAVDASGYAYITGETGSTDFPTVPPGTKPPGNDAFVTKFKPDGSNLEYSTYIGGDDNDEAYAVAVDNSGYASITGITSSSHFPTQHPSQGNQPGDDAFVTRLSAAGNTLDYSTYLGGDSSDCGYGIAVDGSGDIYITGSTKSTDFLTWNAYQIYQGTPAIPGMSAAFVTRISSSNHTLVYSTYLGGINGNDKAYAIAIDNSGHAYVTGITASSEFPTYPPLPDHPFQENLRGDYDAFVTKLSPTGNSLVFSTYLGGDDYECGYGIAVDGLGHAFVTGCTGSSNFPLNQWPYQGTLHGGADAFVTKLSYAGNVLAYSTYLGGNRSNGGFDITIIGGAHNIYNAYVTGITYSDDFPVKHEIQEYQGPPLNENAFVTRLSDAGHNLMFSTYLGGNDGDDEGYGIAAISDGSCNQVCITGWTYSAHFPILNPYRDQLYWEGLDAFVTKICDENLITEAGLIVGTVTRVDAMPINQVTVQLSIDNTIVAIDSTGPDGRYSLPDVMPGFYDIVASKAGYTSDSLQDIEVIEDETTFVDFQLVQSGPSCQYVIGDANNSHTFTGLDITYAVRFFKGGPLPPYSCDCPPHGTWYVSGDVNGSCTFTGLDITYMVRYFKGGPAPIPCPDCPPTGR